MTLQAVFFSFWSHLAVASMASPVHSFSSFTWVSLYQTLCGFPPSASKSFSIVFLWTTTCPFPPLMMLFFLTCSFCEHWPIQGWISHCSQLDLSSFCWLHAFKFCLLFLPLFLFFFSCLFPGTVFLHLSVSHPSCSCQLPLILSLLAKSITLVRKFPIILYFPFQFFALYVISSILSLFQ